MHVAISKVNPKKKIDVGGARLDRNGNIMSKNIQYIKSETYLTELMEEICEKMEDYAKASTLFNIYHQLKFASYLYWTSNK